MEADALHNPPTDEEMRRMDAEWDRQLDELHHKITKDNAAAKAVGQRLKELRKEQRLGKPEVATRAGMKVPTLTAIEEGRYNTGIRQITDIAHALGANFAIVPDEPPQA